MGALLKEPLRSELIIFFRSNEDVFAWVTSDMPGIERDMIEHKLFVYPEVRPVKQKKRHFTEERNYAISDEIGKLLEADLVGEVIYPDWLANVVMVKKAIGK